MKELREFAQHQSEFEARNTELVAISVDDVEHNHLVWEQKVEKKYPILSDPSTTVISRYGLLHSKGYKGTDIAIRTSVVIDENGTELYRRVSSSAMDVPSVSEILSHIPQK